MILIKLIFLLNKIINIIFKNNQFFYSIEL